MFYIYFLFSESSGKFYVGHTNDVSRRFKEHNNPIHSTYTSKYLPWILKGYFPVNLLRGDAVRVENFIKKQKSKKFIEKILENINNNEFVLNFVSKVLKE